MYINEITIRICILQTFSKSNTPWVMFFVWKSLCTSSFSMGHLAKKEKTDLGFVLKCENSKKRKSVAEWREYKPYCSFDIPFAVNSLHFTSYTKKKTKTEIRVWVKGRKSDIKSQEVLIYLRLSLYSSPQSTLQSTR